MMGVRIITSPLLTDGPFEDWSDVRSPGRARRRRSKHKQRIRIYYTPSRTAHTLPDGSIVMHPAMYDQLKRKVQS